MDEEAAELLSEIKSLHLPIKQWLSTPHNPHKSKLVESYGDYPMFARELLEWGGWRECRREYLRWVDGGKPAYDAVNNGDGTNANGSSEKVAESSNGTNEERGRKRRSRWHNEPTPNGESSAPQRRSRWDRSAAPAAPASITPVAPADPVLAALGLSTPTLQIPPEKQAEYASLQSRLRIANSRLSNLEAESARIDALPRNHPDRSPSPPPIYNPDGSRKNTRALRWKEKYTEERSSCLEDLMSLTNAQLPSFIAKRKRSVKIPIPVEEHPTYNFIGLIIGPRGKTQKEMENKTNCKIAIRGKGSIKEGAKGRVVQEGDDEPLHVVVTGDDPTNVETAAQMVRDMLVVIDDEVNIHKQNQLRELALLNGTLKDTEEWCGTCGEKGHRDYECPKRFTAGGLSKGNAVKCAICGETSHVTRDCKLASAGVGGEGRKEQLDEDYSAFMAELDGGVVKKEAVDDVANASANTAVNVSAATSAVPGDSVLTILQPARVVKSDGTLGEPLAVNNPEVKTGEFTGVTTISSTVPGASAGVADVTSSAASSGFTGVTTISSTVPGATVSGVTTISSTVPGVTTISSTVPGVTTISSTIPGGVQETPTLATVNPPLPGDTSQNGLPLPPPPPAAPGMSLPLPPPPTGMPPVPSGMPPPPSVPAVNTMSVPPPPPPPGGYQAYPPQGYAYQYQQPGYAQYSQPPPPQQQQWGANAGAWNQNAYYDPTGGAGGLNWWESSENE